MLADNTQHHDTLVVVCLRCGYTRGASRSETGRLTPAECPSCGHLGWREAEAAARGDDVTPPENVSDPAGIDALTLRPYDRLTGFGNRRMLMADLERAVAPESAPSVLAIFDLANFKQYQRVLGYQAGDVFIAQISAVFRDIVGQSGKCYRSREDEFVALIDGPSAKVQALLTIAVEALRREGEAVLITASFGMALLPDEADEPIAALALADQRLGAMTNRPPRERRQYSRNRGD